jgi:hypothetical protein
MKRTIRRRLIGPSLALGLLAGGCTAGYQNSGPPLPDGGMSAPPANLEGSAPPPPVALGGGRDGVYSGIAVPLNTGGGVCIDNRPVGNFRVQGTSVRWAGFRGRIDGNGLQMVNGNTWVIGRFDDNQFSGQISVYGRRGTPGCSYAVTLNKTGM